MCGLCGKLSFDHTEAVPAALIERMMDPIQHRGPDAGGYHVSGPVGLGHRRLSIIDLHTGHQPMTNEDGTIWLVYNGEIYNYRELRLNLERRGHVFSSMTDTETIIHQYEESGEGCVAHFRGMFAFALWDERKKLLLLARDRVGIKPLYYINTGKAVVFGSEIKCLLADPSVPRDIDPCAIDRFLTYHYLPGNRTLFRNIYKLDPGHYLTVSNGNINNTEYWDLPFGNSQRRNIGYSDAVAELEGLLAQTVKDHMISDVPIGVLLSGGVDSTGVLRYAAEQTDKPIHTFTIGFDGAELVDERPFARMAAKQYGTVHHEMSITSEEFRNFLPKYIWHMEEPIFEPPAVALYFVAQLARRSDVKVLLSGEGGDEAFGGYQNYRNLLLFERLKSAMGPAKGLLKIGLQSLARLGWKRIAPYSYLVDPMMSEYYLSRTATPFTVFNTLKPTLYASDFARTLQEHTADLPTSILFDRVEHLNLLDRMLYVDTKSWLPDDLLVKADKMTMATSVELRVPLLDYRMLEFAASLPPSYKVRGWATKRILKSALSKSVPKEILQRRKAGFPVPYNSWMRTDLREFIADTLLDPQAVTNRYFERSVVQGLVNNLQVHGNTAREVFCLLILELWHKAFASPVAGA